MVRAVSCAMCSMRCAMCKAWCVCERCARVVCSRRLASGGWHACVCGVVVCGVMCVMSDVLLVMCVAWPVACVKCSLCAACCVFFVLCVVNLCQTCLACGSMSKLKERKFDPRPPTGAQSARHRENRNKSCTRPRETSAPQAMHSK